MKWIGISGSWRATSDDVERDVREAVRNIIERGDGIVSGGALNVDFFATDEALTLNPDASRIKIFLPVTFERYAAHYRKRATEGVITNSQAETLIDQPTQLKELNPAALIENLVNEECNTVTYYERNREVVKASDELLAFSVNGSGGTQDAIDNAKALGKPVMVWTYEIA